jgi:hypothetical protein
MKTGRLFWGVLFAASGLLVLLERWGGWAVTWSLTWKLWPLVLILLGAAMIMKGPIIKTVFAGVAALVLAVTLVSTFNFSWLPEAKQCDEEASTQTLREEFVPGVARAEFALNSGAGVFTVEDTTTALIEATTKSSMGAYELDHSKETDRELVVLRFSGSHEGFHFRRIRNTVDVRLNPKPVWDLKLELGASKLEMDLAPFAVEKISLDAGAASIEIALGDRAPETRVSIDAGVSSIRLRVPEGSGCEVRIDAPLSSKRFPGFKKVEKGLYRTENFTSAAKKIYIEMDAGVSSVKVERY